ncbi:MAG: O-antigen ligase family protein [Candidatus Promineifilaceae bacterium]
MLKFVNNRWFPVVNLGAAATAALLWYGTAGRWGWPLLLLVLLPWLLRLAAGQLPFRRSRFDGWLVLFGGTAVLATFTAYNFAQAVGKFWVLVGALAVYWAIVSLPRRDLYLLAGATGPLGVLLAFYFVMTNNWRQWPADLGVLNRLGEAWLGIRPFLPFLPPVHPNALGGMIALLLPFTLAFAVFAWRSQQFRWVQGTAACLVIMAGGLLFTSAVGAWLALALGLSCWLFWRVSQRVSQQNPARQKPLFAVLLLLVLLPAGYLLSTAWLRADELARWNLARQTFFLIQDFALTGSGLATFPALYAEYVRVVPNYYVAYSNLYMDVWLELGFLGFVALLGLLAGSFWQLLRHAWASRHAPVGVAQVTVVQGEQRHCLEETPLWLRQIGLFQWAAFVSLLVLCLQGLTDDAFFGAQATPLLFFAPAVVVVVTRQQRQAVAPVAGHWRRGAIGLVATAVFLLVFFLGFRQTVLAQWHANLGALSLARVELVGWPTNRWNTGGYLGRYEPAVAQFEQALALNPANRTAHHRLGLLAMLAQDYDTAVAHLQAAHAVTPEFRGLVKSLGYSYVWQGAYEPGAALLATIPEAKVEMTVYTSWWQEQARPDLASHATNMVAILENK